MKERCSNLQEELPTKQENPAPWTGSIDEKSLPVAQATEDYPPILICTVKGKVFLVIPYPSGEKPSWSVC